MNPEAREDLQHKSSSGKHEVQDFNQRLPVTCGLVSVALKGPPSWSQGA